MSSGGSGRNGSGHGRICSSSNSSGSSGIGGTAAMAAAMEAEFQQLLCSKLDATRWQTSNDGKRSLRILIIPNLILKHLG